MMGHKDWNGPGWYQRWNPTLEQFGSDTYIGDERFDDEEQYSKRFEHHLVYKKIQPPKPPKPELPDGVYLIRLGGGGHETNEIRIKEGNFFYTTNGSRTGISAAKILGRIPVEPVD